MLRSILWIFCVFVWSISSYTHYLLTMAEYCISLSRLCSAAQSMSVGLNNGRLYQKKGITFKSSAQTQILSCRSDDVLKSNFHRVKMPPPEEANKPRYSIAFFAQPNKSALVQGPKQKYPPITAGEYVVQVGPAFLTIAIFPYPKKCLEKANPSKVKHL